MIPGAFPGARFTISCSCNVARDVRQEDGVIGSGLQVTLPRPARAADAGRWATEFRKHFLSLYSQKYLNSRIDSAIIHVAKCLPEK